MKLACETGVGVSRVCSCSNVKCIFTKNYFTATFFPGVKDGSLWFRKAVRPVFLL